MEDFHCLHALDELDVIGELAEELVELDEELEGCDGARELDVVVHEVLREALPLVHVLVGLGWLRLDLNLGGLLRRKCLSFTELFFLALCLSIFCNLV